MAFNSKISSEPESTPEQAQQRPSPVINEEPIPPRRRSFAERVDDSLIPGFALLLAIGLWYAGWTSASTVLLYDSAAAQGFFITVLATFQWSGSSILVIIFAMLIINTLIEALLWPREWFWQMLLRHYGLGAVVAGTIVWMLVAALDCLIIVRGLYLWTGGIYNTTLSSNGLYIPTWGIIMFSLVVGIVTALIPGWILSWAPIRFFKVWLR
ncbi:MAG: hypothetical protein MI924_17290 [Chloroflexales bacterium]|nr:hypothetical protein [Chloroflexales bacterium]